MDRRNEIFNEALADEVRRGEQRKNRSDRTTVPALGTEPATASATAAATGPPTNPAAGPAGENPIEPDVKSKEETAHEVNTVDGQQQWGERGQKRSIPDDEIENAS